MPLRQEKTAPGNMHGGREPVDMSALLLRFFSSSVPADICVGAMSDNAARCRKPDRTYDYIQIQAMNNRENYCEYVPLGCGSTVKSEISTSTREMVE